MSRSRRQQRCWTGLLLGLNLLPATLQAANDCASGLAETGGARASFEQELRNADTAGQLQQAIRNRLCTRDTLFAFLTGEPGHAYAACFISANATETFWDADHAGSEKLLAGFRRDCRQWALQHYRPQIARLQASSRRQEENRRREARQQQAEQRQAQARSRAQQRSQQTQQLALAYRQAVQQALQQHPGSTGLQWSGAPSAEPSLDRELAARLLASDLQFGDNTGAPSPEHLRRHLTQLLGEPRLQAVEATGRRDEYRLRIGSAHGGLSFDATLQSTQPPPLEARPWVLFAYRGQQLLPVAVVLQTPQQILATGQLAGGALPLASLAVDRAAHLPADRGPLQVQLDCIPQAGGEAMPLRQCLRPDGEISVLSKGHSEQFSYQSLSRQQRDYRVTLEAPFTLLARTGNSNRLGALQLKIIAPAQDATEPIVVRRAVARRDTLFVYSE